MDRITYFEFAGKKYPMSFSVMASKVIAKKFGGLTAFYEKLTSFDDVDEETIDNILFVLETLLKQGAAYMNFFMKDAPPIDGADIVDGQYVCPDSDMLAIGIGMTDMDDMIMPILKCINGGQETEIELDDEGKNVETPKEE